MRTDHKLLPWLILALAGPSLVVIVLGCGFALRRWTQLAEHGVQIQGTVRALTVLQDKYGLKFRVDYDFTVPAPPDPIEAHQSARGFVDQAAFERLVVGGAVTVTYLPSRPDVSAPGEVSAADTRGSSRALLEGFGLAGVAMLGGVLAYAWMVWRERRLLRWGRAVPARVLMVQAVRGRHGVRHNAFFEFRDVTGRVRRGWAGRVGTVSQLEAGPERRSYAAGDDAVALIDLSRPGRADLYPLGMVVLASGPAAGPPL